MNQPVVLWKTTIVIWTAFDPRECEIDVLADKAMRSNAYCDEQDSEQVSDPDLFPNTEMFDV